MSRQVSSYVGLAILFVASFVVFYGVYDYVIALTSESNDGFFLFGRRFLLEFFDSPGEPLCYAGRFLGQFYHDRRLGALVLAACITCFGFVFHRVLTKLESHAPLAQTLLPCAVILVLHTSLVYLLHDTLGLLAGSAAFLGYLSFGGKAWRRGYALAVTPGLYFLAGIYVWLFVAWVVVYEWLDGSWRSGLPFKLGYVVYSLALPLVAWRRVYLIPLRRAWMCPLVFGRPFRSGSPATSSGGFAVDCVLGALLVALLVLVPFWGRLFARTPLAWFWRPRLDRSRRVLIVLTIPILALLVHRVRYDAPLARAVDCRRLYRARKWDSLLEEIGDNPSGDLVLQFMTNSALYHQGRLLDEMFAYPQVWGTRGLVFHFTGKGEMTSEHDDSAEAMYNSDLFYEMGHVNAAFRHAYNSLWAWGRTYEVLRRMAECSMANGNYAMASKYLNLLEKTLFHRDFARRYQAMLADPDARKREFGELRKRRPTVDRNMLAHPTTPFMTLLESNPDNRMAFEYLVAWLLLEKNRDSLAAVCANAEQFSRMGYASVPVHCQEALLLAERANVARVGLPGFRPGRTVAARMEGFFQSLAEYEIGEPAPEPTRAAYADTYPFYFFFVTTAEEHERSETRGEYSGTSRVE